MRGPVLQCYEANECSHPAFLYRGRAMMWACVAVLRGVYPHAITRRAYDSCDPHTGAIFRPILS